MLDRYGYWSWRVVNNLKFLFDSIQGSVSGAGGLEPSSARRRNQYDSAEYAGVELRALDLCRQV